MQRDYQLKAKDDENKSENDVDESTDVLSLLCSAYQAETIFSGDQRVFDSSHITRDQKTFPHDLPAGTKRQNESF